MLEAAFGIGHGIISNKFQFSCAHAARIRTGYEWILNLGSGLNFKFGTGFGNIKSVHHWRRASNFTKLNRLICSPDASKQLPIEIDRVLVGFEKHKSLFAWYLCLSRKQWVSNIQTTGHVTDENYAHILYFNWKYHTWAAKTKNCAYWPHQDIIDIYTWQNGYANVTKWGVATWSKLATQGNRHQIYWWKLIIWWKQ